MASTRLPGKPLADIGGEPMVVHAWRAANRHPDIEGVRVATDHPDIAAAVHAAGGVAIMTSSEHATGTDRCHEAWQQWPEARDHAILNLQGDEPFPDPDHLSLICAAMRAGRWDIVTAMRPAETDEVASENRVKVAAGPDGRSLYFSRSPIPSGGPFHIHIGLYGFAPKVIGQCAALPTGTLEASERLEQLRWLEAGLEMGIVRVADDDGPGAVDTASDLERVRQWHAAQTR